MNPFVIGLAILNAGAAAWSLAHGDNRMAIYWTLCTALNIVMAMPVAPK